MKILIVGAGGQIGRELVDLATERGIEFQAVDIQELDITNRVQVEFFFDHNNEFSVVINVAAYTAVDKAEEEVELAYAVNALGVENLALVCKRWNIPLLHISTDYVFSGDSLKPHSEVSATSPLNIYGKSKLAGDEILQATWHKHIILRVSWVFGKYGNNFVKTILRLASEREVLSIVGDHFGCPTAAKDIARVLMEIAAKIEAGSKYWGIYNYCNSPVTNWYEFATKIIDFGKSKFSFTLQNLNKITSAEYPTKARRPFNSELLVDKIFKDFEVVRYSWMDYLLDVIREISP